MIIVKINPDTSNKAAQMTNGDLVEEILAKSCL